MLLMLRNNSSIHPASLRSAQAWYTSKCNEWIGNYTTRSEYSRNKSSRFCSRCRSLSGSRSDILPVVLSIFDFRVVMPLLSSISRDSSSWSHADRAAGSRCPPPRYSRRRGARKRGPGADRPTDPSCSKRVTVDREERGRSCRYRGSEA
jgi:hypothetical protein